MRIPALAAGLLALAAAFPAAAADLGAGRGWGGSDPGYVPQTRALSWTGFYAGLHAGAGWGSANVANTSGFVLGAHAGYNYQVDRVVVGVEGDLDVSGVDHTGFADKFREKWLGSGRARVGYTFDRFLVFGTGGFAAGSAQFKDFGGRSSKDHFGYAVGFGGEYKITDNLSARAEYLHYGLGDENYRSLVGPLRIDSSTNVVRGGLSFHF